MHYYRFNIGDYHSHTSHLDPLEDIAYRRMIDWCYLHEKQLPKDIDEIARLIRMRTHNECIAVVMREFFTLQSDGYFSQRIEDEIVAYKAKSNKAKESAKARWHNKGVSDDANALRTKSERNANHKPITNNHKPITINQVKTKDITDLFNDMTSLPKVKVLSDARKKAIMRLGKEIPTIDAWRQFFQEVESSDFLTGRNGEWQATFDWLIKPANAIKVAEGNYKNKTKHIDDESWAEELE